MTETREQWLDSVALRVVRDAQDQGVVPAGAETMALINQTRGQLAEVFGTKTTGDTTVNAGDTEPADYNPPKPKTLHPERDPQKHGPAVPIQESVQDDHLICLEDGEKMKVLTRHLRAKYGMEPEDYRRKWGLPPDYPMAAPAHSKQRSRIASKTGSGRKRACSGTTNGRGHANVTNARQLL